MSNLQKFVSSLCDIEQQVDPASRSHVTAARRLLAATSVKVEDWDSFKSWWDSNRGPNLKFIFMDMYGENSAEVQALVKLMEANSNLDEMLHEFYKHLRSQPRHQESDEG